MLSLMIAHYHSDVVEDTAFRSYTPRTYHKRWLAVSAVITKICYLLDSRFMSDLVGYMVQGSWFYTHPQALTT